MRRLCEDRIQRLLAAYDEGQIRLTDWELQFLSGLIDRYGGDEDREGRPVELSDKQEDVLSRLALKLEKIY